LRKEKSIDKECAKIALKINELAKKTGKWKRE
jgi:hypothetical protein